MTTSHPLCAVSGLPIPEGCPTVAYVIVRGRTGMRWSPLGFPFRGLQSGAHALSGVAMGPVTDYTRRILMQGLRPKDSINLSFPRDVEPGEIGRLLAENRLRWDRRDSSSELAEHRVRVMRVRDDVHAPLVGDMAATERGRAIDGRVRDVVSIMGDMAALPRDDGRVHDLGDGLAKAWRAMGPSSSLLSDNRVLLGGPDWDALVGAVLDVCLFEAALHAVGAEWRPSRVTDEETDADLLGRHHATMLRLAQGIGRDG